MNVICLVRGSERYVWLYERRGDVLRAFGRAASNPELSLTWYDAAVLSQKVRQAVQEGNA
ncbi:MAG: hypothetical protein HQ581_01180 [Planctomycetes bacterium]|nr:hypothetical protein [Planctomycetota bacterium]